MIDSLSGEVLSVGLDHAVIECGGVGYRFLASPPTLAGLRRGETTRVLTTLVVKDDGLTLYGFGDDSSRAMFHTLQTVSGLGPKLALACLSVFEPAELAELISVGDTAAVKRIQTIPGVGRKMAERMVLELKDKVEKLYASAVQQSSAIPGTTGTTQAGEQVVEALIGLGFTEKSSRPIVETLVNDNPDESSSALLRRALSHLGTK